MKFILFLILSFSIYAQQDFIVISGKYDGDGTATKNLYSVIKPDFLLVLSEGAEDGYWKTYSHGTDSALL